MIKKAYFLIYKFQNLFKIDLFYLIKGGSWLMTGKIISMGAAFILALIWANWINPDIYGNYQYVLSLVAIISIFSLPSLNIAVIRAVAKKLEGTFLTGFKTQLKWGLLGSISSLAIAGYYFFQGNKNLGFPFLIIAVFIPLFNAALIYTSFLMGRKLFNVQVKYDSITQIISMVIMALTLFSVKNFLIQTPNYIILLFIITVYYSSRTFLRFLFFLIVKNKFKPNKKQDIQTIKFGKHLSFLGIIDVIANNIDKILLFHYLGAIELAVYAFSILVPQQIRSVMKHIDTLALPKFSTRPREEIKKTILKKILYLTGIVSLLIIIYIILAPFVYQFFFPKYITSIPYSRLYALSIIPLCFDMFSNVFRAKMMTKQIYQIKIIAPIFRASLFLTLIPLYGIWGAVIAVLGARTFNALLFLFLSRKI